MTLPCSLRVLRLDEGNGAVAKQRVAAEGQARNAAYIGRQARQQYDGWPG